MGHNEETCSKQTVFKDGHFNCVIENYPKLDLIAMITKNFGILTPDQL